MGGQTGKHYNIVDRNNNFSSSGWIQRKTFKTPVSKNNSSDQFVAIDNRNGSLENEEDFKPESQDIVISGLYWGQCVKRAFNSVFNRITKISSNQSTETIKIHFPLDAIFYEGNILKGLFSYSDIDEAYEGRRGYAGKALIYTSKKKTKNLFGNEEFSRNLFSFITRPGMSFSNLFSSSPHRNKNVSYSVFFVGKLGEGDRTIHLESVSRTGDRNIQIYFWDSTELLLESLF